MTAQSALDQLRFPIGPLVRPERLAPDARERAIAVIARTPADLRRALDGLDDAQLDTPYRPGGWTVRQVAHHVPDSHMQGYTRFMLALTEDAPTITPYDEAAWAEMTDVRVPVAVSLALLDALHERWDAVLRAIAPADFARTIVNPQTGRVTLDQLLSTYAWHGPHHVAHVTRLRARNGW